jgi:hypothetical protein
VRVEARYFPLDGAGIAAMSTNLTVDVASDPTLARTPTDGVDAHRSLIEHRGVPANHSPA